jgi:hypothetical protein
MAQRAMNCRANSICDPEYIILFDNPIAAISSALQKFVKPRLAWRCSLL